MGSHLEVGCCSNCTLLQTVGPKIHLLEELFAAEPFFLLCL
jgi:hypothetical protein